MKFFDMDGTVCESRQIISQKMKDKLLSLDGVPCIKMGQNGNQAPDWKNQLSWEDILEIRAHIFKISAYFPGDCIQNRGCQMSLSFIGHSAPIKDKEKFDPQKKMRYEVLKRIPFKSKTLVARVAGTTCIDYNKKGNLKGDNLKRYMKLHSLNKKDCTYYGDNFSKGGNDESVLGIMKCVLVKNPDDLWKKL